MPGFLKSNRLKISLDLRDANARKDFSAATYAETELVGAAIAGRVRGRCLDIGCGQMPFKDAVEQVADSYESFDVEARTPGVNHIGDIQDMRAIAGATYDSALCLEVLEHVPEPVRAMTEINRILKPGGVLVCSVPHLSRLHEEPHDYFRYTKHGLRHLAESAGFTVVSLIPTGGILSFLGHQASTLLLVPVWRVPLLRQIVFFINKWLLVRLLYACDRRLDRNKIFALGYLCVAVKPVTGTAGHPVNEAAPSPVS